MTKASADHPGVEGEGGKGSKQNEMFWILTPYRVLFTWFPIHSERSDRFPHKLYCFHIPTGYFY